MPVSYAIDMRQTKRLPCPPLPSLFSRKLSDHSPSPLTPENTFGRPPRIGADPPVGSGTSVRRISPNQPRIKNIPIQDYHIWHFHMPPILFRSGMQRRRHRWRLKTTPLNTGRNPISYGAVSRRYFCALGYLCIPIFPSQSIRRD